MPNFFIVTSKVILLFLLLVFSANNAQEQLVIYDEYPTGQDFYYGGKGKLYKDIQDVLVSKNMQKCSDKVQRYQVAVLVKEDSKINLVKDFDSIKISENKCAYDLIRKVLPYLKGWKPAEHENNKLNAIAKILFFPEHFFENYEEGYDNPFKDQVDAVYPGGINAFRTDFMNNFYFNPNRNSKRLLLSVEIVFVINQQGKIEDVKFFGDEDKAFREAARRTIARMKKPWKPATIKNVPVKSSFRLPISMSFESNSPSFNDFKDDDLFKSLRTRQ